MILNKGLVKKLRANTRGNTLLQPLLGRDHPQARVEDLLDTIEHLLDQLDKAYEELLGKETKAQVITEKGKP